MYLRCQQGKPVGRVCACIFKHGIIGIADHGQICQFSFQNIAAHIRNRKQTSRTNTGSLHSFKRLQKNRLQFRSGSSIVKDSKFLPCLLQSLCHTKRFSAFIQKLNRYSAGIRGNFSGEAGETEHLGIQRHGISAGSAQFPLRLMAVLLRYDQQPAAKALFHRLPDFPVDRRSFSAPRFSGNYPQHAFSVL